MLLVIRWFIFREDIKFVVIYIVIKELRIRMIGCIDDIVVMIIRIEI